MKQEKDRSNDMALSAISLFSGVGMLDEGLRAGLAHMGISHRTVCHVEREAYGASVLAARMEEGSMDAAPIWSDVCTFDAAAWHGRVDCIVAGFPCQDLSIAGRRAGLDGKRSGLFFEVVRIATDSGAWCMFLENVAGIATATASVVDAEEGELDERAAARVLGELADRGWDAEWITLSASDVGASHGRARWFCFAWRVVANADDDGSEGGGLPTAVRRLGQIDSFRSSDAMDDAQRAEWRSERICRVGGIERHDTGRREADGRAGVSSEALADTGCGDVCRLESQPVSRCVDTPCHFLGRCSMADPIGARPQVRERGGEDHGPLQSPERPDVAGVHRALGLFAPGPADEAWQQVLWNATWLAPALSIEEQHDAQAAFEASQPILRGVADGLAPRLDFDHRAQRLKCGGNGVVALCAAVALVTLVRRSGLFRQNEEPMNAAAWLSCAARRWGNPEIQI